MATDPFDALRRPDVPIEPPAGFAAALRRRLEAELGLAPASSAAAVTTHVTPYLAVHDARDALRWYAEALGAEETFRLEMPDGRIGHAEFHIGEAAFMVSDESPEVQAFSPRTLGGSGVLLHLRVPDVDRLYAQAVAAGAVEDRPPADQPHGHRHGVVIDPYGHRWMLSTPIAAGAAGATPAWEGRIGYFTLGVPDSARARAFYGGVFGWRFEAGSVPEGFHIPNTSPPGGLAGGTEPAGITLYFAVADIHAAVARVREFGGEASEPVHYESGWNASCRDDQGLAFDLFQPRPGYEPVEEGGGR